MAKEILIVDDEPNVIVSIQFLMEQQGYRVMIAERGEEAVFAIFPTHRKTWAIRSIPKKGKKFEYCKLLPTEWGGRHKDFAGISDVHDALYCHNGCFLAEAKSLEGADKLAVIALEN